MKIKNILMADIFTYILVVTSCIVLAALFYYQPKISDDWYSIWQYQGSNGIVDYWVDFYTGWTGRLSVILLTSLLHHPVFEAVYRLFIVVEVLMLIGLAWFCALGNKGFNFTGGILQAFILFGMLLWLSLPARSETVSWFIGNSAYLVSGILGLFFMAWSKYFLTDGRTQSNVILTMEILKSPFYFLIGFFAGSSQEQIISACVVFTAFNIYREIGLKSLKSIPIKYWILLMGFCLGALVLVAAPGNYVRMEVIDSPTFLQVVKRMFLYIPSAFFEIGTGGMGKPIWLGIIVLIALFYNKNSHTSDNTREARTWIYVCLSTLLVMIPATNQISPRTTFFAIIFLYIAVASFLFQSNLFPKRSLVSIVLLITSLLVLAEATVGLISNISVTSEVNQRWALVNANHSDQLEVPFIATVPANLTYIETPEHDRAFLNKLSGHVGFRVRHDSSKEAPLPVSLKPLKVLKFK